MTNSNSISSLPKRKSSLQSPTLTTMPNRSVAESTYDRTKFTNRSKGDNITKNAVQQQQQGGAIRNFFQSIYMNRSTGNNSAGSSDTQQPMDIDANTDQRNTMTTSEYFKRYELMTEYVNLRNPNHCPLGIYVLPLEDNFYEWYGVIFVHKGYYRTATFKFIIDIPQEYPNKGPSVRFVSDIFHPLIDRNGVVNMSQQFPVWRPYQDYIFHVLHYVKNLFKKTVLEKVKEKHAYNKEAYRLYKLDKGIFAKLTYQCAQLSISDAFLYDTYPIQFSPLTDAKFDEVKALMLRNGIRSDETLSAAEATAYTETAEEPEEFDAELKELS